MKSCLKCHSDHPVPGPSNNRPASSSPSRPKCVHRVSFRDQREYEVHTADDWDRTPVDVAHKLSYEDILELKEMQVAAAKACARASAASGVTPKYCANVPLGLLPLLPDTGNVATATSPQTSTRSFSPLPQTSPNGVFANGAGNNSSPGGIGLAEACLCRVFSADTGLPAGKELAHGPQQQSYGQQSGSGGLSSSASYPPRSLQTKPPDCSPQQSIWQPPQFRLINGVHQIPSPPVTPPRLSVTSIPPPPPTAKARHFAFLPLLDASSSSTSSLASSPSMTPIASPSTSGMSSPVLPPGVIKGKGSPVPPVSLAASLSMLSSPPLSSSSSYASTSSSCGSTRSGSGSTPSPGAYTTYDPYGGSVGVGGNATLGLERKLGYKFVDSDSDSQSVSSEEGDRDRDRDVREGEDKDWPHDWPGRHPHHLHHPHHRGQSQSSHHSQRQLREDVKSDPKAKDKDKDKRQHQQQQYQHQQSSPRISKLPPSPPAEPRSLPLFPLNSSSGSGYTSSPPGSRSRSTSSPRGSPRASRMSSPSRSSTSSPSPSRTRKSKMSLPLVTLA